MVNSKDFAELAGVSKAAVAQAIKAGKLLRGVDGLLDETNPKNAKYIAEQHAKTRFERFIRSPESGRAGQAEEKGKPAPPPSREGNFLRVEADLGSGFQPIVEYRFDADDMERPAVHFPLPFAVEIEHAEQGPELVIVRRADSEDTFLVRLVSAGDGQALARRGRA